jgi:phage terminase large subunit GpA-like protein
MRPLVRNGLCAVRVVVLDEVDKLKPLPEGDADSLASKRASTFGINFKILRFSKPTDEGTSRINRHYVRGTQSRYFLPCPACGEFQELAWGLLRFDDYKLRCGACNEFFDQDTWLDQPGEWRETVSNAHHKSFQCSALISGFIPWALLIDEYRQAVHALQSGDDTLIRVFENSRLGQVYGAKVEKVEADNLYERREYFGPQPTAITVVPYGTVAVTLGIDTQSDGFYWLLACFGRKMETWLPLTGRIIGDMRSGEPWEALSKLLGSIWLDREDNGYRSVVAAIDAQGDFYPEMLAFIRSCPYKYRPKAIRGYAPRVGRGMSGIGLLRNSYVDKTTGVRVTNVDVDAAKTQFATMLARQVPGPGYFHLPADVNGEDIGGWDFDTVSELVAEYRRSMPVKGGYSRYQWFRRPGKPNHRLDCAVYALAALALSRLRIDDCSLQRIEARNMVEGAEKTAVKTAQSGPRYGVRDPSGQPVQPAPGPVKYGVQPGSGFWPSHDFSNW